MDIFRFFSMNAATERVIKAVTKPRILFVEGFDECLMCEKVLTLMSADPEQTQIISYDGKEKFGKNLVSLMREAMFLDGQIKRLAILQDADNNISKTKYDITQIMNTNGLNDVEFGSFRRSRKYPKMTFGAFVLPDNVDSGNLETLLLRSVEGQSNLVDAKAYIQKHAPAKYKDDSKRVAQVFLCVHTALCRGAGQGASNGYFDLNSIVASSFGSFLKDFISDFIQSIPIGTLKPTA